MTQTCSRCKEELVLSAFNRNKSRPSGYAQHCRQCIAAMYVERDRPVALARYHRLKAETPEVIALYQRRTRMLGRYGLTITQFEEMEREQEGKCALCGKVPEYRLFVDHCHETGRVRGLLCARCNGALGWYQNRRALIESYVDEIEETMSA